jgi:hypothetical protein
MPTHRKTRRGRHSSRKRSTRRMRGGVNFTALNPFAAKSAVAPRPKNKTVRLGSVSASMAAKQYKEHQKDVEDILLSLTDGIESALQSYRPDINVKSINVKNVNSKLKFTAEERNTMKTQPINIPLERLGSLNAFQSGVEAVKNLLMFYKQDTKVGLLEKLRSKLSNREAADLATKLQREMGVDKESIHTLLKKLENNQLTVTEAAVLVNILTTVMKDLQPTVNRAAGNMMGGGALEIAEKVAYAVFAVFMSVLAGGVASVIGTPIAGIAVFAMSMQFFYKKEGQSIEYVSTM